MVTNINLPVVLSFENEDHVNDFVEAAQEIIPKLKYVHIAGEGYNCIMYTRKDKAFRSIMVAAEAPVAIVETPVDGESEVYVTEAKVNMQTGSVSFDMPVEGANGYHTMPTDPKTNVK